MGRNIVTIATTNLNQAKNIYLLHMYKSVYGFV
jgi:hypothetical protein